MTQIDKLLARSRYIEEKFYKLAAVWRCRPSEVEQLIKKYSDKIEQSKKILGDVEHDNHRL